MDLRIDPRAEWLEADGLGGYASGTAGLVRTRRYHALLLAAARPSEDRAPVDRRVLVNGFEAWVETPRGRFALSSQTYGAGAHGGGVIHPDGAERLESFRAEPWPSWTWRLEDGTRVSLELFVPRGQAASCLTFRLLEGRLLEGRGAASLVLRPLLSGRDYHSLHRENGAFVWEPRAEGERLVWSAYPGVPRVAVSSNGRYEHDPLWYRSFFYQEERERGLDAVEDLASPGSFRWDLTRGPAVLVLEALVEGAVVEGSAPAPPAAAGGLEGWLEETRARELARRQAFPGRLERAADSYLVRRGAGWTVVAGYPWFTDWGRDTFISLRGLCLATGRLEEARAILAAWAGSISQGMLPNRFPDGGDTPEYNSVDASLWFVVAAGDLLEEARARRSPLAGPDRDLLLRTVEEVLQGYSRGTRHGIRLDADGLLASGEPGVQLTWMDARADGRVVTPRSGKPVEVQALWLNALWIAGREGLREGRRWEQILEGGRRSFDQRFWNAELGHLHDVVDPEGRAGTADPTLRPNQTLAVGGLPLALLSGDRARRVVDVLESRLWTPLGLRTLDPRAPGYRGRYEGGVAERDAAYHQGTAWPWLLGPFVEAWVKVRGGGAAARAEARRRFLEPLLRHLDHAGLGHVSEIADGDPPHTPRGCPFQAWSVGEALRLERKVLAEAVRDPDGHALRLTSED